MNAVAALRDRRLRALGVEPLGMRACAVKTTEVAAAEIVAPEAMPIAVAPVARPVAVVARITRLALQPDPAELEDPAVKKMYTALTEAVSKAGLQSVRVCDVADDPSAAVMVFGAAPLPAGVPARRVLRTDPLSVLHVDRERKRLLWEHLQALGRGGGA